MSAPTTGQTPAPVRARGPLTRRADTTLPDRLARSAAATRGTRFDTAGFHEWFAAQCAAGDYRVTRAPLAELPGWSFQPGSGNLVHRSGRFFSVEGVHACSDTGPVREWHQPIVRQPEVGILGMLVKEFDGVLHFLMQAKMEPGNLNVLQLSPTVQATRSNFTKVHGGAAVEYLEYFAQEGRGRVLVDSLQSEHGSWFLHKSNRNMVVEAFGEVEPREGFRWLTLGQIGELLRRDNLVNMDSRTVLACLPMGRAGSRPGRPGVFAESFGRSWDPDCGAVHSDVDVKSWLTAERSRRGLVTRSVPLAGLPGWTLGEYALSHDEGRYFDVVGVHVEAGSREVTRWSQPLIEPRGVGEVAFVVKRVHGVLHVLAQARTEAGFQDTVQVGPTVQCTGGNHAWLPPGDRPPFLDLVLGAAAGAVRYEAVHSEEGGRFLNAQARCRVVEAGEDFAVDEPPGFRWLTLSQMAMLTGHDNSVNVQARTLMACINLLAHSWG
ncbi:NDP-hexose 2,3-dehydratase family protein [Streptomyces kanamyceticus]|uniref:NDP-hexose 2,3-dehydratase family protein n=1 Tax=Streptomyces kanamyceticus TaxID=1967 RepID=UPI0037DC8D7A